MKNATGSSLKQEPNGRAHAPAVPTPEPDRLEPVLPWGKATQTLGYVFRPNTIAGIAQVFELARRNGLTVGLRGSGNSYGDAACNESNIVLDLTRCDRILEWDPSTGVITVEPGVRLQRLWEYILADGWWPPVCTGTMHITMGGGAAMNVHGKNAYKVGPIGDHILAFDLLLPSGEIVSCSRSANSDLFHAAIGGCGLLGCFTSLTLQMKRIYSGLLEVESIHSRNLSEMFAQFAEHISTADYLVGWVDTTAGGATLGRGEIHKANYLPSGADRAPHQTLRLDRQHLGDTLFGLFPRSAMWRLIRPFFNPVGVPVVNSAKYWSGRRHDGKRYRQPHAQFHFLLNYFPDWEKAAGPGGLIQYQPFVPRTTAEATFAQILELSRSRGLAPYLGVLKQHRPDPFWLTHGLDGFSLALDYRVTEANRGALLDLCYALDELVLAAGGRFYPAKDSVLRPHVAAAYLGAEQLEAFRQLKQRCDPDCLLQTNFWRRVLQP